jgi:uncharacterized protein (DUF1330 family)
MSAPFTSRPVVPAGADADNTHDGSDGEKKGYWISNSDISDMDGLWLYRDANRKVMTQFGAKFLVMHGPQQITEGASRSAQTLVEFPSYQAALDCFNHPDYHEAAKLRHKVAVGSMVIVEGYSGRQDF